MLEKDEQIELYYSDDFGSVVMEKTQSIFEIIMEGIVIEKTQSIFEMIIEGIVVEKTQLTFEIMMEGIIEYRRSS